MLKTWGVIAFSIGNFISTSYFCVKLRWKGECKASQPWNISTIKCSAPPSSSSQQLHLLKGRNCSSFSHHFHYASDAVVLYSQSILIYTAVISAVLCPTWESLLQWDKTGDYRQEQWWHRATIWWEDGFPTAAMSPVSPRHLQDYQNKLEGTSVYVCVCVCVFVCTSTCGLLSPVVSSARWIDRTVTWQRCVFVCACVSA